MNYFLASLKLPVEERPNQKGVLKFKSNHTNYRMVLIVDDRLSPTPFARDPKQAALSIREVTATVT